ncbi:MULTISPECIES: tryptophan RNA-binding attenuator protein inhibitory protein [unclassified Paenibacillus]|uniref:tryptophan RNA-binding attenuator protein inhibitory protein n=1 Tax=unclassified Paenibacillus TaxID=185978 RepID=UPI0004666E79|nr:MULTISPECIES: tryptophan RNA-binding attenuator protein inhibitory protein [unclassified Paenibacillus]KGP85099.1 tryptophan RNA-binding attenuator protein inhibitory protein [Paenibacillus sp. MAEPY2]KGP85894.1 tryptophan RNA-binding attenuator protein inhibitory protein [Paenibacillus sp. MAEPY1]
MSVVIATDDLELPCPNCNREKYVITNDKKEPCTKCDGKGVILTALGQTLLHFFKKHSQT